MGEPVPGAEITLEQEPDDEPIVGNPVTGSKGEFSFNCVNKSDLPDILIVTALIKPPAGTNYKYATNKVLIPIRKAEGMYFEGNLYYKEPTDEGKAAQGGFAVSGRSSTIIKPPNGPVTTEATAVSGVTIEIVNPSTGNPFMKVHF